MFARLLLAFIIVPFLELTILVYVAGEIGFLPTLALILTTAVTGASLAKWQGMQVWREVQREMQAGRMPASRLVDGVFIFGAGLLLLTPGLLTDVAGFSMLLPWSRAFYKRKLRGWMDRKIQSGEFRVYMGTPGSSAGPGAGPFDRAETPWDPGVTKIRVVDDEELEEEESGHSRFEPGEDDGHRSHR